jgi:hypothetical protein
MIQQHSSKNSLSIFFEIFVFNHRIPEEHREKIEEWMENDFKKRIDGQITRSRCLFLVGPTLLGIYQNFFLYIIPSSSYALQRHCFTLEAIFDCQRDSVSFYIS